MAKSKKNTKQDAPAYAELVRSLREQGPGRLYMLWGEEDYLRDSFCAEIKKLCFPDGGQEFGYHRLSGLTDMQALREAVDSLPFFCERTMVEVRDADVNKLRDSAAAELSAVISDMPDYCSIVLLLPTGGEPDGRLSAVKAIIKYGAALKFQAQSVARLMNWVERRFASLGKSIDRETVQHLIFRSGALMNTLIPEIIKIASYAEGNVITRSDIDAAAHHLPEAVVFDMTDRLADGRYDEAAGILAELLAMSDEPPVKILAVVGQQFRRLYCAKLAEVGGLGRGYIMSTSGLRYDFQADKLVSAARHFSEEYLARAVELCADCDYDMKSSSVDDAELLKELLLRLWGGLHA